MDAEHIRELFREFGPVGVRPMFGGAGLYADGVMFALISDDLIYLKASATTVAAFERENCPPFEYGTKAGKRALIHIGGCRTNSMTIRKNWRNGRKRR